MLTTTAVTTGMVKIEVPVLCETRKAMYLNIT
jgi:hypothetical protein